MIDRAAGIFLAGFFDIGLDEIDNAVDQRVRQPFFDRFAAPGDSATASLAVLFLHRLGKLNQPFGRVGAAIEQHVFDPFQQIVRNIFVHRQLSGVDDAHVQAGFDGVIQKRRVHRLADHVVAAERKRNVADAAGNFRQRQILLDSPRGLDEVHRVAVVLFHARADGQNVRDRK